MSAHTEYTVVFRYTLPNGRILHGSLNGPLTDKDTALGVRASLNEAPGVSALVFATTTTREELS